MPLLTELVCLSALPLATLQVDIAVDSTGFGNGRNEHWFSKKYEGLESKAAWVSCHAMAGVKTNVIEVVKVLEARAADYPQLPDLAREMTKGLTKEDVCADRRTPAGTTTTRPMSWAASSLPRSKAIRPAAWAA